MKSLLKRIQVVIFGCIDDLSQDKLNLFIPNGQVEKEEGKRGD
jgi:hypothetical protein